MGYEKYVKFIQGTRLDVELEGLDFLEAQDATSSHLECCRVSAIPNKSFSFWTVWCFRYNEWNTLLTGNFFRLADVQL